MPVLEARSQKVAAGSSKLQVEIVTEDADFHALEGTWNSLLARSGTNTIFLTFEWLSTWWKHFGHRHDLLVLVVRRAGEVVALFPSMITHREGFRQLGMIGNKISDYKDFIIDDGEDREEVIRKIFQALDGIRSWDYLLLNGYSRDSVNYLPLRAALSGFAPRRSAWIDAASSPYVPMEGDWNRYFAGLKKSFRDDITRAQRRMEKRAASHSYSENIDDRFIDDIVDDIITLNAKKYLDGKGRHSVFDDPVTRAFYKEFANVAYPLGWLRIPVLTIDGEIAARFLDFQYDNKYYGVVAAYNSGYSSYSPGRLLLIHQLRRCFEDGVREFDLLGGTESYKFSYNPRIRTTCTIGVFQRGRRGRFARRWVFGIRPFLERMSETRFQSFYWWYRKRTLHNG